MNQPISESNEPFRTVAGVATDLRDLAGGLGRSAVKRQGVAADFRYRLTNEAFEATCAQCAHIGATSSFRCANRAVGENRRRYGAALTSSRAGAH